MPFLHSSIILIRIVKSVDGSQNKTLKTLKFVEFKNMDLVFVEIQIDLNHSSRITKLDSIL